MANGGSSLRLRVARVYREKGMAGVWFGALTRVGYRHLALLERRPEAPIPRVPVRARTEVRPLDRDDETEFVALGREDARAFRARLEGGQVCWGAWNSGGLRHVQWVASREAWIEDAGCRLLLDEGVVYVSRAYTDPAYRGIGLAPATEIARLHAMRERGGTLSLGVVVPENRAVVSLWLKLGWRRIGFIRSLRVGRRAPSVLHVTRHPTAAPGWSVGPRRAPTPV